MISRMIANPPRPRDSCISAMSAEISQGGENHTICGRSKLSLPIVLKTRSCSLFTIPSRSSPREAIVLLLSETKMCWERECCRGWPFASRADGDDHKAMIFGSNKATRMILGVWWEISRIKIQGRLSGFEKPNSSKDIRSCFWRDL